jgi:hypothetical protein
MTVEAESAADRFTRDYEEMGGDLDQWSGSALVDDADGRKDRTWDQQDLERREREYVDAATGENAEGDGPYNGE